MGRLGEWLATFCAHVHVYECWGNAMELQEIVGKNLALLGQCERAVSKFLNREL